MKRVLAVFICAAMTILPFTFSPAIAEASPMQTHAKAKPAKYAEVTELTSTAGKWNRNFSKRYTTYTLKLAENEDSTTLTPKPFEPGAAVLINGIQAENITIHIDNGQTQQVKVKAAAPGKKSRVYTIKVTRAKSTNNALAALSFSAGTADSALDPAKPDYTLGLDWYSPSVTVSAAKAEKHAVLRIDGKITTGRAYTMSPGPERIVNVTVKSQAGAAKTYKIHITRAPNPFTDNIEALIDFAKHYMGKPYVSGGKGPDCFDCSGFVYYCLKGVGVPLNYMTSAYWAAKSTYPTIATLAEMVPGDILCFKGHVGIYMGEGKMIDCVTSAGGVRIGSCTTPYWTANFICGKRVLTPPAAPPSPPAESEPPSPPVDSVPPTPAPSDSSAPTPAPAG